MLLSSVSIADDGIYKAEAFCSRVAAEVDLLIEWTETVCIPTKGRQPGAYSFLIISAQPVFSAEKSKKGWLLVVVGSVGKNLNKISVKADELWLSDVNLTKKHVTHVLPANIAQSLQRKIKADQISIDTMYIEISKNLTKKNVSKKE
jgi:hypothetical protein